MRINTPARLLTAGGSLTGLACLFQLAPVWLHGPGLILSPLATLPVALAAILSVPAGVVIYIAASFLILLVDPQEAAIFLLTTGLLGIALGAGYGRRLLHAYIIAAGSLLAGLFALTDLTLISVFGSATPRSAIAQILVFLPFAMGYAAIWFAGIRYAVAALKKWRL